MAVIKVMLQIMDLLLFASVYFTNCQIINYFIFSAYNTFLGSLSAQNVSYTDCLNPRFIIANDASPIIGYAYAGLMNMFGYQCGAGLFRELHSL